MRTFFFLFLFLFSNLGISAAAPIDLAAEDIGYGIPPGFVILGHGLDFTDDYVYIWAQAEGNCRWESHQECFTSANGQVVCRTIRERVCDHAATNYRLPESVTVDEDAAKAYYTAPDGTRLAFGKIKGFLWSKWIVPFEGAQALVNYQGAKLRLDPEVLGQSLDRDQFLELYGMDPAAD